MKVRPKSLRFGRSGMNNQTTSKVRSKGQPATIEDEYLRVFTSIPLQNHGPYGDNYSLEQPSELKYMPSTTSPHDDA